MCGWQGRTGVVLREELAGQRCDVVQAGITDVVSEV
eukprot:SAG31_NODE_28378_length_411_cov_0.657051_1_plen_35_part_10